MTVDGSCKTDKSCSLLTPLPGAQLVRMSANVSGMKDARQGVIAELSSVYTQLTHRQNYSMYFIHICQNVFTNTYMHL